ncbi:MAG: 1-phosphofructokinase [Candidatus Omnitrophica bacterium]|nr:1-phosphofructokinase [Candidatus Omnitrophota bacterium]
MIVTVTLNPSLDEWVWMRRLDLGTLNRAVRFQRYAGGKGINVARGIHELGANTLAVAMAGGSDGQLLGKLLSQDGIAHRFVTIPGETRNNYQIQTDRPRGITQINTPGPTVSRRDLRHLERLLRDLPATSRCIVLSGSLPPGVSTTTYARLLRGVRERRALTVLDASGASLRHGLSARPWLIKPNRAEAEELLGRSLRQRHDIVQAAQDLVRRGPASVLLSMGEEGAVLAVAHPSLTLFATTPRVKTNSPVGAGDSLVAGFAVGWLRTRSWRDALRLGVGCGAACAMTPGTELFHRADALRLARRVVITTL